MSNETPLTPEQGAHDRAKRHVLAKCRAGVYYGYLAPLINSYIDFAAPEVARATDQLQERVRVLEELVASSNRLFNEVIEVHLADKVVSDDLGDSISALQCDIDAALSQEPALRCCGYPDCDGDLVAEPHSEKCPLFVKSQEPAPPSNTGEPNPLTVPDASGNKEPA